MRFSVLLFGGFLWASICFSEVGLKGMIVEPEHARWSHAIVPYMIDEAMPPEKQTEILEAITLWEAETVVRFLKLTAESPDSYPDYVLFQPASGRTCASSVGRQGGLQLLRLAPRCHTFLIAHELGHLLGLWHEQTRLDRNLYLDVRWENIQEAHCNNFKQRTGEAVNHGAYDYDSIMHYSEYAFSQNGKPTLVPRVKGVHIGQRTHLSAGDIAAVNALYENEIK
jgi:hypothetical protein